MKTSYTRPLILFCLSLYNLPVCAWVVVENFEGYRDASELPTTIHSDSPEVELYLLPDPACSKNTALHIFTGHTGVSWADTHVTIPFPKALVPGPGTVTTLYWRAYEEGTDNNWSVGMTDRDAVTSWADYVVIMKVNESSTVTAHHRRSYHAATPPCRLETGVWNQFWMVLDVDRRTYQLWVQRPIDPKPVQHRIGRGGAETELTFRRAPGGPLTCLTLTSNSESPGAPNAGDVWYLDDFYIDEGINLTTPDGVGGRR